MAVREVVYPDGGHFLRAEHDQRDRERLRRDVAAVPGVFAGVAAGVAAERRREGRVDDVLRHAAGDAAADRDGEIHRLRHAGGGGDAAGYGGGGAARSDRPAVPGAGRLRAAADADDGAGRASADVPGHVQVWRGQGPDGVFDGGGAGGRGLRRADQHRRAGGADVVVPAGAGHRAGHIRRQLGAVGEVVRAAGAVKEASGGRSSLPPHILRKKVKKGVDIPGWTCYNKQA